MGFWQGLNEGLTYVLEKKAAKEAEDRAYAFKREEYQKTLLAAYQDRYIERLAKKTETKAAMQEELSSGIELGLTDVNALVLQRTGQLRLFLDQYEKNKKVDKPFVKDLNIAITNYLKDSDDETISTALINGVSTDKDTTDPEQSIEALAEAIYSATNLEELQRLGEEVYAPIGVTPMAPLDLNFNYVSGPELSDTKAMKNQIASSLQAQFGDSFSRDAYTGDIDIAPNNNDADVANLFAMAIERAKDLAYSATSTRSPTEAAAFVAEQIRTSVNAGNLDAKIILNNFDTVLEKPEMVFTPITTTAPVVNPIPEVPVNPTDTEEELQRAITGTVDSTFNNIVDADAGTGQ
jgi:hypothetical protein